MTETPATKSGRVIINIEKKTLNIILWLNIFIFIGLFILGFIIGKKMTYKKEKSGQETKKELVIPQLPTIKKNDEPIKKDNLQENILNENKEVANTNTASKQEKKEKIKNTNIKYPQQIVVNKNNEDKMHISKHINKENKSFTIQVISLKDFDEAQQIANSFIKQGYDAKVTENKLSSGIWYRVRIGNYKTKEEAYKEGKILEETGIISSFWISEY